MAGENNAAELIERTYLQLEEIFESGSEEMVELTVHAIEAVYGHVVGGKDLPADVLARLLAALPDPER
jgi:hypothetical protein